MNGATKLAPEETVAVDFAELDRLIETEFGSDPENLIMILQAIQRQYNYLPHSALSYLADKIHIPLSKIYGVATFYSTFSLYPRGRHIVAVCLGTACHVRGSEKVREALEEKLNISVGETTQDGRFTLETVRCVGGCSLGPMLKINDDIYGRLSPDQIDTILDKYK